VRSRSSPESCATQARRPATQARRHGGSITSSYARRAGLARRRRSRVTIARENEIEGCLREAFGALLALALVAELARVVSADDPT
jgi:hypothetical protein